MKANDTLLISYDAEPERDHCMLIVGRKRPNSSIDIIGAFGGEDAKTLYEKLVSMEGKI